MAFYRGVLLKREPKNDNTDVNAPKSLIYSTQHRLYIQYKIVRIIIFEFRVLKI